MRVALGSDLLFESGRLRGRRVGLVANPASVDGSFRHVVDRAASAPGVTLAAVFGPQHGFRADLQDNMIETPHARDARRRVPVYSLYSDTREPTAEMLAGLDALVIDLQDVGARIYTFVYTMANCLRAAARHGVPVIVCDRPNPIGGEAVEGPMLAAGYESFVGLFPIPMRHGMTIGELARLFNERFGIGAELEVVPLEGWRREMYWDDTRLPWVMPSPNMPTARHRRRLPWRRAVRGDAALGRARHDPPVRVAGRAVDRRGAVRREAECAEDRRGALPARRLRADLPQARAPGVRRRPDSRHRSADVPAGPVGRGRDGRVPPQRARPVRLAPAAVRVRARPDADRHSRRLGSPPPGYRSRRACTRHR